MAPGGTQIKGLAQFKEVIGGDKPVIIDFSAEWCGPCKESEILILSVFYEALHRSLTTLFASSHTQVISPIFNKLAEDEKYKDNAIFVTLDVDEEEDIAQEVGIKAMPTFMVFKNGEKVETFVGADKNKLPEFIAKYASGSE